MLKLNVPNEEFGLSFVKTEIIEKGMNNICDEIEKVLFFFEERVKIELEYSQKLLKLPDLQNYSNIKQFTTKNSNSHNFFAQNIQENIIIPLKNWKGEVIKMNQETFPIIKQLEDGYEVGMSCVENLRKVQNKIANQVDQLEGKERELKNSELKSFTKQYQIIFNQTKTYENNYLLQKKELLKKIETNWITTLELMDMYFKFYIKEANSGNEYQPKNHREDIKTFIKDNYQKFNGITFQPILPSYSQSFAFEKVMTPIVIKEDHFDINTQGEKNLEFFMEFMIDLQGTVDPKKLSKARELLNKQDGRLGFAMGLNQSRSKAKLSATSFKVLGDLMYIALSKCENDTGIGRIMFNMCQTYYRKNDDDSAPQYLTDYLKNHVIWKSIQFWDNMINDAIDDAKRHHKNLTKDIMMNIVFGQLSAYSFNMLCMELKYDQVLQFCEKFFTKYNLTVEYQEMIKQTIESSLKKEKREETRDLRAYSVINDRTFLVPQEKVKKSFFKEIKKK